VRLRAAGDVKVDSGLSTAYSPEVVAGMRFRLRSSSEQVRVNELTGVVVLRSSLDRASLCPYADHCRIVVDVVVRPAQVSQSRLIYKHVLPRAVNCGRFCFWRRQSVGGFFVCV